MSILTDYYKFERVAIKSKTRLDCTASTRSYPEFEEKRTTRAARATEKKDGTSIGDLIVYFGNVPDSFGGNVQRKADKSLTIKGKNLSSIYVPDVQSGLGYGDVKGTTDALLFMFHDFSVTDGKVQAGAVLEVFIARGKSKDRIALFNVLTDGELDEEIEALRKQAVTKSVTTEETEC